ncbi:MAG: phosphotransferase [Thermoanaerobaculia bacterium]|nr:phosphotransferase [Thermoanaerobaculia bacterium]
MGVKGFRVRLLGGDVSPRRYFRVAAGDDSFIVAVYPEEIREAAARFETTTRLLESIGVVVPRILEIDLAVGLMLLEDAGEETLFDRSGVDWEALAAALAQARGIVERIQTLAPAAIDAVNPRLDGVALMRELQMTWDLYLEPESLCGEGTFRQALHACLEELCRELGREDAVPCHRDFMARNLIPRSDGELLVLDHQDLRMGPKHYDLASLTNDSLFLSSDRQRRVLGSEIVSRPSFRRSAAQRSLKIAGTFVSFAQRGSPRYLPWVGRCLARGAAYLSTLPEAEGLEEELRRLWQADLAAPHRR